MNSDKQPQTQKKTTNVPFGKQNLNLRQIARAPHPASIIQRTIAGPDSLTPGDVLQLQRTIGNQAVGQLLAEIGRLPSTTQQSPVQRQPLPEEEELLQGKMMDTVQRQPLPEEEELLQGKMMDTVQRQPLPEEEELLQGKMMNTVQRQVPEEEELLQGKMMETVQRQPLPEEEELLQGKMMNTVQRQVPEEEELLQGKMMETVQRQGPEEEELMQGKFASGLTGTIQAKEEAPPNRTGMPDHLKSGIENISDMDLSGVRVHYNSSKPKQLNALAYTQGQEIHVGSGQEKHLPHEGWHVVQQMQGRVKPTMQAGGVAINDDGGLEREADVMGTKAMQMRRTEKSAFEFPIHPTSLALGSGIGNQAVQRITYDETDQTYKAGGEQIAMEEAGKSANCHGHTYGTWSVERKGHNPEQSQSGVGLIVEKEAGELMETKNITSNDAMVNPPKFKNKANKGNLIVIKRGDNIIHSASVTKGSSKKFDKVEVSNVQGYGGVVEASKQLNMVSQVTKDAKVCVYEKTPKTTTED